MKMLSDLTKAAVNTVILPVKVAADVVTFGGILTSKDETYTGEQAEKIMKNLDDSTAEKG